MLIACRTFFKKDPFCIYNVQQTNKQKHEIVQLIVAIAFEYSISVHIKMA